MNPLCFTFNLTCCNPCPHFAGAQRYEFILFLTKHLKMKILSERSIDPTAGTPRRRKGAFRRGSHCAGRATWQGCRSGFDDRRRVHACRGGGVQDCLRFCLRKKRGLPRGRDRCFLHEESADGHTERTIAAGKGHTFCTRRKCGRFSKRSGRGSRKRILRAAC